MDAVHWQEPYDYFLGWLDYYKADFRQVVPEALQLVWADESDVLPWESGFDEDLRPLQPLLDIPPTVDR